MWNTAQLALANLEAAGLREVVYLPGQESYTARNASYWSLTTQLHPWAIIQPRNPEEVSRAVKAVVATPGCNFAVRSGGNMCVPGSNNISDGITIDLDLLSDITYNPESQIASFGPGAKWGDVYTQMTKYGRMLAGGRDGGVSAGGVMAGGGIAFHTCRYGFGCDQVLNFEVVLADGRIVNANKTTNPALFQALKGGGNNFGIITRFDTVTFPVGDIWDCTLVYTQDRVAEVADALVDFVENLANQPNDHMFAMWAYRTGQKEEPIILNFANLDGEENPKTLKRFLNIPSRKKAMFTTIPAKTRYQLVASGNHDAWYTVTFRADPDLILKASTVFATLKTSLQLRLYPLQDHFQITMFLQPLPTSFASHSQARGGNMLGLEHIKYNSILLLCSTKVESAEVNAKIASPALRSAMKEFESYAEAAGGLAKFQYANYAHHAQDPLGSVGTENIRFMKGVARQFDPQGVFQRRVPGGFKLDNAQAANELRLKL
ncbi:hypothetical protein FE257_001837 [Aspergillus nanangensis]|uniref:FAD-binding PCMH-type domain-containing protein n=1 Tax=Aspergillus nanangensis TaxID=2582783 RepID=A0AAD4GPF1_ASPNN|nr:hypothetical protein FE257_001837 [Aspergillus nanangensis]